MGFGGNFDLRIGICRDDFDDETTSVSKEKNRAHGSALQHYQKL